MNELWSKDRLHKIFSKDSLAMTINAHASGDGSAIARCCRLCGGDTSLRIFSDTYTSEGVEERYDQLMYDCFDVRVFPTDSLICDHCVRQLRNINHFRALVYTAFVKPRSEYSPKHSQLGVGEGYSSLQRKTKDDDRTIKRSNDVVRMRKRKIETIDIPKKREVRQERRMSLKSNKNVVKRMNIACMMCKQRYPMMVPFDGWKEFICSRCKKKGQGRSGDKRCKLKMATSLVREQLTVDSKTDVKGQNRLYCSSKRSTQLSKMEVTSRSRLQKYQCSLCPKRYVISQHLVHHNNTVHAESKTLGCPVCSKEMISKEALEKHKRTHTGQPMYQCDVCLRKFKGKRSFQAHYLTHGK